MSFGLPAQVALSLLQLIDSERFLAYAVVDEQETIVRIGGHWNHYGLGGLELHAPAAQQLYFVEGMLPLVESPFLIRSLGMPSGRVADVNFFASNEGVWVVLLDTTSEHDEAQRVQQKAYDMTLLSEREARLIQQLEAANSALTLAHAELDQSRQKLMATHDRLRAELDCAAQYVRACLPEPTTKPLAVDWLYEPAAQLGGDSFGYHWIDDEHFAIYLLDVCGHGIGAALLSVAASQTLRTSALPYVDFHDPESVLSAMNDIYQMELHDNLFFTMWYGVYHQPTGVLRYASAGHGAPILVSGTREDPKTVENLNARGPIIGMSTLASYRSESRTVAKPARLYLFSDGVYEISRPDGSMLEFEAFTRLLSQPRADGESELKALFEFARSTHGSDILEDDFSIVKLEL